MREVTGRRAAIMLLGDLTAGSTEAEKRGEQRVRCEGGV